MKTRIFTPEERKILKKFMWGAEIETEEEKKVVDKWASVGFVLRGFNWESGRGTAKLTDLGIRHLNK